MGCCSSTPDSDPGTESRPATAQDGELVQPLLKDAESAPKTDKKDHRNRVAAESGGGGGGGGGQQARADSGTSSRDPSAPASRSESATAGDEIDAQDAQRYHSISKNPAALDFSKSARKRRKQNGRCQLLVDKQTAGQSYNAATAPSRTHRVGGAVTKGNETDIRLLVKTPAFAEVTDWLAVHTVDFFNDLSLLCGTILDSCTSHQERDREICDAGGPSSEYGGGNGGGGCHSMTAGSQYKYLWKDADQFPTPTDVPAAQYINAALEWVDIQLDDADVFPPDNQGYGEKFRPTVKKIFKLFFRIYGHLYHSHFNDFVALESETHLNDSFRHFLFFVEEFKLLNSSELPPLKQLIAHLQEQERQQRKAVRVHAVVLAGDLRTI